MKFLLSYLFLLTVSIQAEDLKIMEGRYLVNLKFQDGPTFLDELYIEKIVTKSSLDPVDMHMSRCSSFNSDQTYYEISGTFDSPGLFTVPIDYSCLVKSKLGEHYSIIFHLDEGAGIERYLLEISLLPSQKIEEEVGVISRFRNLTYEKLGTFTLERK